MKTKYCVECDEVKPLADFTEGRNQCNECRNELSRIAYHKRSSGMKVDYIDLDNAMRITGLTHSAIWKRVQKGEIRAVKVKRECDGRGFQYKYHIDDCRVFSWPGTKDIAHYAGVKTNTLQKYIFRHKIPMAKKVAAKWRFHPRTAEIIAKWAQRGYPVPFRGIVRR